MELYDDGHGHAVTLSLSKGVEGLSKGLAAEDDPDAINAEAESILEKIVRDIFETAIIPEVTDLIEYYAGKFWEAVTASYGKDIFKISYDTPDYKMLKSLQENVYQFSAAKNYTELKQLSDALLDGNGKLRTFAQFKEAAKAINANFATKYMQVEYNMAVESGQMAAKWARIQENKEVLPLMQFDAVMDDRTTIICQSLDGVIKPIDDPFWDIYYPPNHWGCRSDVRSLADGTVTPNDDIVYPDNIPDMFKTNLAKNGLVFPPGHPYYIDNPAWVAKQAQTLTKDAGRSN